MKSRGVIFLIAYPICTERELIRPRGAIGPTIGLAMYASCQYIALQRRAYYLQVSKPQRCSPLLDNWLSHSNHDYPNDSGFPSSKISPKSSGSLGTDLIMLIISCPCRINQRFLIGISLSGSRSVVTCDVVCCQSPGKYDSYLERRVTEWTC